MNKKKFFDKGYYLFTIKVFHDIQTNYENEIENLKRKIGNLNKKQNEKI